MMINYIVITIILCLFFSICFRFYLVFHKEVEIKVEKEIGMGQTTGTKEIQADEVQVVETSAGVLAVLADGIGKQNTGRVSAQIAIDTILDKYEPYEVLHKEDYFFKTAFLEANKRIQATIGERRGGASVGVMFTHGTHLSYAVAGNIRIALVRNKELIPLNKGQTLNVLAVDAWKEGKITKRETLWSLEEDRVWNYVGMDGFKEIELCSPKICLKDNDIVVMASKGIFEEVSWREMEDILIKHDTVQELTDKLIELAEKKESLDKENGSVIVWKIRMVKYEKD